MQKLLLLWSGLLLALLPHQLWAQNKPDLALVAPFSLPAVVAAGEMYSMSANVRVNVGSGAGAQFSCVGFFLSLDTTWDANDVQLEFGCQGPLLVGQTGQVNVAARISALTAPGQYYLVLVADPFNIEQDPDKSNNVVSFPLQVVPGMVSLPDVQVRRPSISFDRVPPGGTTGAFAFLFNQGDETVSNCEIGFYLSADTVFSAGTDVFMGQVIGFALPGVPNGSGNPALPFAAPVLPVPRTVVPGNYYLLMVADHRNLIPESDETNNSRALPLVVTGSVLATSASTAEVLQVYPNPVAEGATLTIRLPIAAGQPAGLTLLDALGRPVARQTIGASQSQAGFDTTGLPAGFYSLQLLGPTLHVVRRVLIR